MKRVQVFVDQFHEVVSVERKPDSKLFQVHFVQLVKLAIVSNQVTLLLFQLFRTLLQLTFHFLLMNQPILLQLNQPILLQLNRNLFPKPKLNQQLQTDDGLICKLINSD